MEKNFIYACGYYEFDKNNQITYEDRAFMLYYTLEKAVQHLEVTESIYEDAVVYERGTKNMSVHYTDKKGVRCCEMIRPYMIF